MFIYNCLCFYPPFFFVERLLIIWQKTFFCFSFSAPMPQQICLTIKGKRKKKKGFGKKFPLMNCGKILSNFSTQSRAKKSLKQSRVDCFVSLMVERKKFGIVLSSCLSLRRLFRNFTIFWQILSLKQIFFQPDWNRQGTVHIKRLMI